MTECETQLAELQHLCMRTLEILDEENFWIKTEKDGFLHSSLQRDLKKASDGKQFKMFRELMKHLKGSGNG